jgi:superfamily II DNA or RNA helicase
MQMKLTPRDWQAKALETWSAGRRGVISVVTGGGKTVFAEICATRYFEWFPSGQCIIVVPSVALLDQWFVSLQEELGVEQRHIACFSGEEKSRKPARFNLCVINTARTEVKKIAEHAPTFLVVDECHRAGSAVNALALGGRFKATLGLSATPRRQYDSGFEDRVESALGPIIYVYDYTQASIDGVISPFEIINVRTSLLEDEQASYDAITGRIAREVRRIEERGGDAERLKLLLLRRAAISSSSPVRIPIAAALAERHPGERILIFHERIGSANALLKVLVARKHSATIYHSRIGPNLRRDNLRLYRTGAFDTLVTCRALDEGMNVPETTVAIVASSTRSERQRIQRLGRVLRTAPGKKLATIYTIYATKEERIQLEKEAAGLDGVAAVSWAQGMNRKHG